MSHTYVCVLCRSLFGAQVAAAVRLLAKGADRHLRDHEGRTAMDWANRFGSTRLLDVLLFDPHNVKIFLTARERDVRGVLALMEQGVDPNTTCPERNYTPLIAAVFNQVWFVGILVCWNVLFFFLVCVAPR